MHTDSIPPVTSLESPVWSNESDTLVHVVRHWAAHQPTSTAYVYVADGKEHHLTFGELHQRATAIGSALRSRQAPGTTAIMLHPLGLDFVEAFFGCLYSGIVAVPLHPGRGKSANARLSGVVADCNARSVLTTRSLAAGLTSLFNEGSALHGLEMLQTDAISIDAATVSLDAAAVSLDAADAESTRFEPSPDAVAFLQYTSGSTSQPKGTMVSHRNIMANQAMLSSVLRSDRSTVIVSWLPVFHDMGLIGNVLHAAYLGARAVLLSTLGFIKSPISWLRAIDRYQATVSGAPNFAYDLCVAKTTPSERAGLDLSSWRAAFNGAEPVRQRTLEEFARAFAPYGFRRSAFVPTYGLAEATLVVSGTGGIEPCYLQADARLLKEGVIAPTLGVSTNLNASISQVLVSTGRWDHGDQHVAIVDPETGEPCGAGRVGEIWISGSHVAAGYWGKEAETRETFGGVLPGDERRYLKTGDLGFADASGLFITGRMKDLIIFRGQNIYPQDIELTVELSAPELRPGCTAAFSLEGGPGTDGGAGTGLVVVAELDQRETASPELLTRVARRVQEQHELPLDRLVLVRRNAVPKTTSGKIQRRKCREELLGGRLSIVDEWRNPTSLSPSDVYARAASHATSWIVRHQAVAPESVEVAASIASYGLDSIQKVEFVHSLEEAFAISIPESSFFELETIDDLLREVVSCSKRAAQLANANNSPATSKTAALDSRAVANTRAAPSAPPNDRAAPRASSAPAKLAAPARVMPAMPAFSAMSWGVRGG